MNTLGVLLLFCVCLVVRGGHDHPPPSERPPPPEPHDCHDVTCSGHGECREDHHHHPECHCDSGYSGDRCQTHTPCADYDCNHGRCYTRLDDHNTVEAHCKCDSHYIGTRCNIYNKCHDYDCHNGTCHLDVNHHATCKCNAGYSGSRCLTHDPCNNHACGHGACMVLNAQPHCACLAGYYGTQCELSDACHNATCGGHGTCHEDAHNHTAFCTCDPGYSGGNCHTYDPCHNYACGYGACMQIHVQPYCVCLPGYLGTHCEAYDACYTNNCGGHGTCHQDAHRLTTYCKCDAGYSGSHCQTLVTPQYVVCNKVYLAQTAPAGTVCSDHDQCHTYPCVHGACMVINAHPYCVCLAGHYGTLCELTRTTTQTLAATASQPQTSPSTTSTPPPITTDTPPVDGGWGNWLPWSLCSLTCGDGIRIRRRDCDDPVPANGGQFCTGSFQQTVTCKTLDCRQAVWVG